MTTKKNRRRGNRKLFAQQLERRDLLAANPFGTNPLQRLDVSRDGVVSALDALRVINAISRSRDANGTADPAKEVGNFIDVSRDGKGTALDALMVINALHRNQPVIAALLPNDSAPHGITNFDLLTSDYRVDLQVSIADLADERVKLRINGQGDDPFTDITGFFKESIASLDVQTIDQLNGGPLGDGDHLFEVEAGSSHIQFTISLYQTPPNVPPASKISLETDTGRNSADGITFDSSVAGRFLSEIQIASFRVGLDLTPLPSFAEAVNRLQPDGSFLLTRSDLEQLLGTALVDGPHELHFQAIDVAGNASDLMTLTFVLDTTVAAPTLGLSVGSDSGPVGDQTTSSALVTLLGQAEASATLTMTNTGAKSLATATGMFQFPNVPLGLGENAFTLQAEDIAGNLVISQTIIHRNDAPLPSDPVLEWNKASLEAIRVDSSSPPVATRNLAMVSLAMFDVVSAVERTPGYYVNLAPPAAISLAAAISGAAQRVLEHSYPSQTAAFHAVHDEVLIGVPEGSAKSDGLAYGRQVADAIIALRHYDGWDTFVDFVPGSGPGVWQHTPPMYAPALLPQWSSLQPFSVSGVAQFLPSGPPSLDSHEWADAFNEVKSLGSAAGSTRTAEQTEIARFWADGGGTETPPGHWNLIANQLAEVRGNSFSANARLFAQLNVALADAAIASWDAKYAFSFWRPVTAIEQAELDGNVATIADPTWLPLLITPPFPEYTSGHSTFSGAAAAILTAAFGELEFDVTSLSLPGVTRSFASFDAAAYEAGRSRVYGGIHYEFSNQAGLAAGRALAEFVLDTFSTAADTRAPRILLDTRSGLATDANFTLTGSVLDDIAGVALLEIQVDGGGWNALAFDAHGRYSIATNFALDGSGDGPHVFSFRATDAVGNIASSVTFSLTLDTSPPEMSIDSLVDGGKVQAGAVLAGTIGAAGAPITQFTYALNGQAPFPIPYPLAGGPFSVPLDLSKLAAGTHVLTVSALDQAGNSSTTTLELQLDAAIPLHVVSNAPRQGAIDVGSTFHPKIVFSRSIDPSTLTDNSFFATDAAGKRLDAYIAVSKDGTFAWLFFASPLPSSSRITVHVDGDVVRGAIDNSPLDGDANGTPGGELAFSFTTVSLTPLLGTSLSGKIVEPGPDLKPMTLDDLRAGADQVLYTLDDVFLRPVAGVKVFVVGLEDQAVVTDAEGNFHLDSIPAGNVKLAVDGRTATNAPSGAFFPEMVMDIEVDAAQANTVMGSMGTPEKRRAHRTRQEVYLPRLQTSILRDLSSTEPTVIGVEAASAPNLTPQQRAMMTIEVQPGSLLDRDGNPVAGGQIGITTVPPELVREMLPPGILQHTFDITIQAPGVTNFSAPASLTFPNTFGAAPGTQLSFLSFDHTTGRLVIEGTATVSVDGLSVRTDPGDGITHPGWHGVAPPGGPGGPGGGDGDQGDGGPPPPLPVPPIESTTTTHDPIALPMVALETNGLLKHASLAWSAPTTGQLTVNIEVDGPLDKFMKRTGNLPLQSQTFTLAAGNPLTKTLEATSKNYEELFGKDGYDMLGGDQLYGAKIRVSEVSTKPNGTTDTQIRTFYLYRWVLVVYAPDAAARSGNIAAFQKTLNDGAGKWSTTKTVDAFLPSTVTTAFATASAPDQVFKVDGTAQSEKVVVWHFDPIAAGTVERPLMIKVSDKDLIVGELKARGTGISPVKIDVNKAGYRTELKRVLEDLVEAWNGGGDQAPGKFDHDDDENGEPDDESELGWPGTDDIQETYYPYKKPNNAIKLMALRGPAARLGLPGTVIEYVVDKNHLYGLQNGERYDRLATASLQFEVEFSGYLPNNRADVGTDTILTTADDKFTAMQLTELDAFLEGKANEMVAAVASDFAPVDRQTGAFDFVDSGGDLTLTWEDTFLGPDRQPTTGEGIPMYGSADFDSDHSNDHNGDTIVLRDTLDNPRVPLAAKVWALAEELNTKPTNRGRFSVAINSRFKSNTSFANFVANTVSHELGHTFGLLDSYVWRTDGASGAIRTAPEDIMRSGDDSDPDLTFQSFNVELLRAAMGIAPEGDVGDGVRQYRSTFNQPQSATGIRENSPGLEEDYKPRDARLVAVTEGGYWYGGLGGPPLDLGEAAADGDEGESQLMAIGVHNAGGKALDVSTIALVGGLSGFVLEDTTDALGDDIEPGETVEFFVRFDPAELGDAEDFVEIVSNAPEQSIVRVPLVGVGVHHEPSADLKVKDGGNFGGVVQGQSRTSTGLATITNVGKKPLLIQGIRFTDTGGAFRLLEIPADLATNPISLAKDASFVFGGRFTPDKLGLTRAMVEVTTNDPEHPVLTFSLTGTGTGQVVQAAWGNDFISVTTPGAVGVPLRVRSDDAGNFELFLPSSSYYEMTVFDPETGLVARETGMTSISGQFTTLASTLVFTASSEPDSDSDGLPDDIEHAIGTSTLRADTDGNGLDDFAEIQQGLDPFGGRPIATGILAQLPLQGEARQLAAEGASATNQAELVYLATGSYGLAIVDVSQFAAPVLLAELDLPGDATDISIDPIAGLAAVATGAAGLQIVDITKPTAPTLLHTIDIAVSQVEVTNGIAYVGVGEFIKSYDLRLGLELDTLYLGTTVGGGLARDGGFLYATSGSGQLMIIDIVGLGASALVEVANGLVLKRRGSVQVPFGTYDGQLSVGGGIAYVMNTSNDLDASAGGFATVDVSDPDLPKLISARDNTGGAQPAAGVAPTGSGLALVVGSPWSGLGTATRSPRLELQDVSDPRETARVLRSTLLPSDASAVLSVGGAAFIANGSSGLVIVNYLPFDTEGQAPELSIAPPPPSISGNTFVAQEGMPIRLTIDVQDDVQVRSAELLWADNAGFIDPTLNDFQLVRTDLSFPFDLEMPAPPVRPQDQGTRGSYLRVRVTDTGGNVTLSAPINVASARDARPPVYLPHNFINGSVRAVGLTEHNLYFSEPLARTAFTDQNFRILDALDQLVSGFVVRPAAGDNVANLSFDGLAAGSYRLVIEAPNIKDRSGFALGTSTIVTQFTIAVGTTNIWRDDPTTKFGDWHNSVNWSLGRVPGPTDLVVIDIPGDEVVAIHSGVVAIRSLQVSGGGTFLIQGGADFALLVDTASHIDNLQFAGGRFDGAGDIIINKSLKFTNGVFSGTGELRIAKSANAEFSGLFGVVQGRSIVVEGSIRGSGSTQFFQSPTMEIRPGATFTAAHNFRLTAGDGLPGRIDLFGTLTTDIGASVILGPEIIVMPGGEFAPRSGRMELQGGGQFNAPLNTDFDAVVYLRGPADASKPLPLYTFPAGMTHRVNGPLLIGGGRVVMPGDIEVRHLDFVHDSSGSFEFRLGSLILDGTLTVTEVLGGNRTEIFNHPFNLGIGSVEGTGLVIIAPDATFIPTGQQFRGVTIINRGLLDLGIPATRLVLGAGSVFEHEGTLQGSAQGNGSFRYANVETRGFPQTPEQPLDRGIFNARVPLEFRGPMRFSVPLNAFAGLTVTNEIVQPGVGVNFTLLAGGTFHGPVGIDTGVIFNMEGVPVALSDLRAFSNIYTFAADSQVQISGDLRIINSSLIANANVTTGGLTFLFSRHPQNTIFTSTISGPGDINVNGSFNWGHGRIATTGVMTVKPTGTIRLGGGSFDGDIGSVLDGTTLVTQGTSLVSDNNGRLTLMGGALLRNEGTFRRGIARNEILSGAGGGRIENHGLWILVGFPGFGVSVVDVPVFNHGMMRIGNPGNGSFDSIKFSNLDNEGTLIIEPKLIDTFRKGVEVRGIYRQTAAGTLRVEVQSSKPSSPDYYTGRLDVTGEAFLAGNLEVDFVQLIGPGSTVYADRPEIGESYPLVTFTTRTGGFAQMRDVDLTDGVTYAFNTSGNGIDAVAIAAAAPLLAASLPLVAQPSIEPTAAHLALALIAAIDRRSAAGFGTAALDQRPSAVVQLGAGWGWFVDATPEKDREFIASGNQAEQDRMDLLTVPIHGLRHLLGRDDDDDGATAETLEVGARRTGAAPDQSAAVDQVFAELVEGQTLSWLAL